MLKFTEARHDALVGTDSIKSRVRMAMLGEENPAANAVFSGKIAYKGLIPMEKAVELVGEEYCKKQSDVFGSTKSCVNILY